MNIVKKGNDAIFSLFLFKDNQGGLKLTADNVQDFEPLNVYDPNIEPRLRDSIRVEVEHLYPTYLRDVPHRAGNALNEVRMELPADLQQLGDFNVVVNFEYKATELEDGWRVVCLKGFLCKVVETDAETAESTSPLHLFVSPILKGDKPKLTLEKVPDRPRYYLKDEDGYIETSDGERASLPAETSALIDYAPIMQTPIKFSSDFGWGYVYGWMPSDDEHFRGKFMSVQSLPTLGYWSTMGYAITPPWSGYVKSGFYIYGLYVFLPHINQQPIAGALKEDRRFALVMRIKTDGEGQVSMHGEGNNKQITTNTPDNVACDVAFPCELNTGRIRIEIKTPNTTNLGGASFVVTDFRFVELDKDDKELDRLYY